MWHLRRTSRARKRASREQEGGLQCLGAKFSSALFWVTTFTMFLHPESFRLPARLRCFQLMDSHAYLTTGLVQGLPSSLIAALQPPPPLLFSRMPTSWVARMGSLLLKCSWALLPEGGAQQQRQRGWGQRMSEFGRRGVWAIDSDFCASLPQKDGATEGENA